VVASPTGERFVLEVKPRGVPDSLPFGGAALEVAVGWLWHAVRYPRRWRVVVTASPGFRTLVRSGVSDSAAGADVTRAQAEQEMERLAAAIESGEYEPL
jgi:hypothetical protein